MPAPMQFMEKKSTGTMCRLFEVVSRLLLTLARAGPVVVRILHPIDGRATQFSQSERYALKRKFNSGSNRTIVRLRRQLTEDDKALVETLDQIELKVATEVGEAVEFAKKSPAPDPLTASQHIFV